MRLSLIFILIFCFQPVSSQEKDLFKLEFTTNEKSDFETDYSSFKRKSEHFYEDETYIVKDSCRGEFGGVIEFRNKDTDRVFVAKATCPSSLIKTNSKYYLTTSLAHLSGSSGIYEINDPKELTELKVTDSEKDKFFKKRSDSGLKELYRNIGGTILVSFPYQDKLYFITSNKDGTYLTQQIDSKFIKIKKLLDDKVYTYETGIKITDKDHYVNNFQIGYGKEIGFFDIKDNVIRINLYK